MSRRGAEDFAIKKDEPNEGRSPGPGPVHTPVYRITDLHVNDRPREWLASLGPQVLTNAELLAILLKVGVPGENAVQVGQWLLLTFNGLSGLHRAAFHELCEQHGIGEAKAAQLKTAIKLGNRLRPESPEEKPAVNSPADAAALVQYEMSAPSRSTDVSSFSIPVIACSESRACIMVR